MQRVGLFLALTTALALAAPAFAGDPGGGALDERVRLAARDTGAAARSDAKPASPTTSAGQHYGAEADARIQIRVKAESWITVRDAAGAKIFSRKLAPGDVYHVPAQSGLRLFAGRPEKLRVTVDGHRVKVYDSRHPSLDEIALDSDALIGPAKNDRAEARGDGPVPPAPAVVAAAPAEPKPVQIAAAVPLAPAAPPVPPPEALAPPTPIAPVSTAAEAPVQTAAAPSARESPALPETESIIQAAAAALSPNTPEPAPIPEPPIQTAAAPPPIAPAAKPVPPAPRPLARPLAAARTAARENVQASAPARPAASVPGEIPPDSATLLIEVGKGTLVRLRRPATTVFVANPEIADVQVKTPGLIYVAARQTGDTVLYAVDDKDQVLLNATVRVNHNLTRLREALRAAMPNAAIEVQSVDGALMLMGAVESAQKAEEARRIAARYAPGKGEVINQLKVVAPNQVHIRVRFAEVSRDTLNQLGFNWNAVLNTGSFLFGIATGNPVIPAAGLFSTLRDAGDGNINSLYGRTTRGNVDLNTLIDALGKENLITILAEPNLTALSGETASFLAGGEFPVPVPQDANTITIQYKRFGVALDFVPTLLDGDRINLKVRPEVSQLTNTGAIRLASFDIPALTVRRAETTIELGSGQSFAIAGLLKRDTEEGLSKTPGLGDVPVLGALFRSDRYKRAETELVILVTPYVVRPVSARMAAPTDGLVPPNDVERIIGGQNYKEQIKGRGQAPAGPNAQGLVGPAGFALD